MRSVVLALALLAPAPAEGAPLAPLLDGLGSHHHAVTTRSPGAQRFFDQGLSLVYAFNHDEAVRSFREAARLDPGCAMAFWGQALALGPNYHGAADPGAEAATLAALREAQRLAKQASPVERDYIDALAARYVQPDAGGQLDRARLDERYARAMKALAAKHRDDLDAQVLYAEALMDLRPWKLWQADGTPAPGTAEIVATLERVLAEDPDHPGANHYYVHALEGSPHPERALGAARRLPRLMPGAGHIVHMPVHVYVHTGMWKEASDANERAIAVDRVYLERAKPEGRYELNFAAHNFQFLWVTASMEGRSKVAIRAAKDMAAKFPDALVRDLAVHMPAIGYTLASPLLALVRFGRWDDVLAVPPPAGELGHLAAVRHFARALAHARRGEREKAREEAAALRRFAQALSDRDTIGETNSAPAVFAVASALADGAVAEAAGKLDEAIARYTQAVAAEDALLYDEPPPWPLPSRHFLGAALLAANRPAAAAAVFEADLEEYPENGWSLFGLAKALSSMQDARAKGVTARFERAWSRADVELTSSRF